MPIENFEFAWKMQKSKIQKHGGLKNLIPQAAMFFKMQIFFNFFRFKIINEGNLFFENLELQHY